jgi:hypothetical protein
VSFAKLGVTGVVLLPILKSIGTALMWMGNMLLIAGRALLLNPLGLAITAIAVSVALIYKYWEPITTFFSNVWANVKAVFTVAMHWFSSLSSKFTEFGRNLMHGFIDGITGALSWVKNTVMHAGESIIGWFKEKLGIKSPSKVFAELGDYTIQGLTLGLQRSEQAPLNKVSRLAKRITQLGAGIAISTAAMPAIAFDTRAPLASQSSRPTSVVQGDTINITIHSSQGANETAIADAIARVLEDRDRQKAARRRSGLMDY